MFQTTNQIIIYNPYILHIFPPSIAAARLVALRERRRAGAVGRRGGLRLVAGEL